MFLNPNLSRLHQFEYLQNKSPLNYTGVCNQINFRGFHLGGGLSQLNLQLALGWKRQRFGMNRILDYQQAQAIIANLLNWYPVPGIKTGDNLPVQTILFAEE